MRVRIKTYRRSVQRLAYAVVVDVCHVLGHLVGQPTNFRFSAVHKYFLYP